MVYMYEQVWLLRAHMQEQMSTQTPLHSTGAGLVRVQRFQRGLTSVCLMSLLTVHSVCSLHSVYCISIALCVQQYMANVQHINLLQCILYCVSYVEGKVYYWATVLCTTGSRDQCICIFLSVFLSVFVPVLLSSVFARVFVSVFVQKCAGFSEQA